MNDFQLNNQNHEDTHMELRAEGLVKRYGKRTVVNDVLTGQGKQPRSI